MNKKFIVDFGFTRLGRGKAKKAKSDEPKRLNQIIVINDSNPIKRVFDADKIKDTYNDIINDKWLPRFMTITISPPAASAKGLSTNYKDWLAYKFDDKLADTSIQNKLQQDIWDSVFNVFKKYQCKFVACMEYHKHRIGLKHSHVIYTCKNRNRIRLLKKHIKSIVGTSRYAVKDDVITGNIQDCMNYLQKIDENNINLKSGDVESPKEYVYWNTNLKKS